MNSQLAVSVRHLDKRYGGARGAHALRGISLDVHRGEIFGLLGRNGAGKTTLVKILLGIIRPTGGEASVLGQPAGTIAARAQLGYLPEDHRFPDYHTAETAMHFYGRLSNVSGPDLKRRVPELLDLVGLSGATRQRLRGFSKGMKQRLGLAQALVHRPNLVLLDEPTDGVDPIGRSEIRTFLRRIKEQGVTIFLNSHLLSEVEQLCDRVAILESGSVHRLGTVEDLTRSENVYVLTTDPILDTATIQSLASDRVRVSTAQNQVELAMPVLADIDPIVDALRARGIGIRGLTLKRQSLEDVFIASLSATPGAPS